MKQAGGEVVLSASVWMCSLSSEDRLGVSENEGYPILGSLVIWLLLFRVLYWGSLYSETPIYLDAGKDGDRKHLCLIIAHPACHGPLPHLKHPGNLWNMPATRE